MPDVRMPDGVVVRFPDGMPEDQIRSLILTKFPDIGAQAPQDNVERSVFDVPLSATRGVASGAKFITDVFGAENPASRALGGLEGWLASLQSAGMRQDEAEMSRIMQEAEDAGIGEQVKAAWDAFKEAPVSITAQALGTAVPTVLGGLAGGALRLGTAGVRGVQLGIAGAMGAGIIKSDIYEVVEQELLSAGVPAEAAKKAAGQAQSYAGDNLDLIASGAFLGALTGYTGIEPALARVVQGKVGRSLLGRAARGVAAEAIPEAVQAGQEQLAQNVALQREGFDVPTSRGIAGQAALEGLAGGVLGGGVGAFSTGKSETEEEPPATESPDAIPAGFTDPYANQPANVVEQAKRFVALGAPAREAVANARRYLELFGTEGEAPATAPVTAPETTAAPATAPEVGAPATAPATAPEVGAPATAPVTAPGTTATNAEAILAARPEAPDEAKAFETGVEHILNPPKYTVNFALNKPKHLVDAYERGRALAQQLGTPTEEGPKNAAVGKVEPNIDVGGVDAPRTNAATAGAGANTDRQPVAPTTPRPAQVDPNTVDGLGGTTMETGGRAGPQPGSLDPSAVITAAYAEADKRKYKYGGPTHKWFMRGVTEALGQAPFSNQTDLNRSPGFLKRDGTPAYGKKAYGAAWEFVTAQNAAAQNAVGVETPSGTAQVGQQLPDVPERGRVPEGEAGGVVAPSPIARLKSKFKELTGIASTREAAFEMDEGTVTDAIAPAIDRALAEVTAAESRKNWRHDPPRSK
jgi:hypothetical protein